jgi:hypothetical protein
VLACINKTNKKKASLMKDRYETRLLNASVDKRNNLCMQR